MTIDQAEARIRKAGGNPATFWEWMQGQTLSLNDDGSTNVYDEDVMRFILGHCDPNTLVKD